MIDIAALAISFGFLVIGLGALTTAALIGRRAPQFESSQDVTASAIGAGPIMRLDFEQSLDPDLFAQAVEEDALSYARHHLRGLAADGTTITLQILRQWMAKSEMVVSASPAATTAIGAKTAGISRLRLTGRRLPLVVDSKSGNYSELMKEIGDGRKLIASAAALSTVVVAAAHMIATADLARTLGRADQKLNLLLAYREIDKTATLERIYTSSRELLAAPLNESRRLEIWRLRGELRELRTIWRREIEHHLEQIENPLEEAWAARMFTRQSTYDNRISEKLADGLHQLMMVEYSLRIDRVLAAASGSWEASEKTLTDELSALNRVGTLLKSKADFISERRRGSAQPMIDGINTIVAQYRALVKRSRGLTTSSGLTVDHTPKRLAVASGSMT